jgi:hypothetical protein
MFFLELEAFNQNSLTGILAFRRNEKNSGLIKPFVNIDMTFTPKKVLKIHKKKIFGCRFSTINVINLEPLLL